MEVDAQAMPEGQFVRVVLLEDEPVHLTASERAWLKDSIEEGERAVSTDAMAFLAELEASD